MDRPLQARCQNWLRTLSCFSNAFRKTRSTLKRPAKILEAIQSLFDDVDACGVAEPDGAIVPKGGAGNDGDVRFTQETIRKILRCQPELTDIHQYVKCPLRFNGGDVRNLRDTIEHVVAAHIELFAHVDYGLLIAFQRCECAMLRERRRIRCG